MFKAEKKKNLRFLQNTELIFFLEKEMRLTVQKFLRQTLPLVLQPDLLRVFFCVFGYVTVTFCKNCNNNTHISHNSG